MYVFSMGLAVLQEQCYFLHLSSYFAACAVFFFPYFSFSLRVSENLAFHPTVTLPMTGRPGGHNDRILLCVSSVYPACETEEQAVIQ